METIAITGANRGIGLATARLLAEQGHRIILLCRDRDRGRAAMSSLPYQGGRSHHQLVLADLASLDSVRQAALTLRHLGLPLAVLVNNAAVLPRKRKVSADGYELQLAVTHLGHFLLTNEILPLLKRYRGVSRVVTVSSTAHRGRAFDFSDPNCERRRYRHTGVYQQVKLANVLFTLALARRLEGTNVEAMALHPGVYETGLLRDYMGVVPGGGVVAKVFGSDPEVAAPILAEIAAGRRDENLAGAYLDKSVVEAPSRAARDVDAQERLWAWSEAAVRKEAVQ